MGWPRRLPPSQRSDHEQRVGWCSDCVPGHGALGGDAFSVGLSGLPARACVPFVSALAGDANVRDVIVGNTSVLLGNGGTLDVPGSGLACGADGAVVDVVYYSGRSPGRRSPWCPRFPCPPRPPSLALQRRHRLAPYPPLPACPMQCRAFLGVCRRALGLLLPRRFRRFLCAQRSGASAAPNAGPHPAPPAVPCRQSESSVARASCPTGTWGTETVRTRRSAPLATWINLRRRVGASRGVGSSPDGGGRDGEDCRPATEPPRGTGSMAVHFASLPVRPNRHAHLGAPAGAVAGRVHPLPVRHHRPARPHLRRLVGVGRYGAVATRSTRASPRPRAAAMAACRWRRGIPPITWTSRSLRVPPRFNTGIPTQWFV